MLRLACGIEFDVVGRLFPFDTIRFFHFMYSEQCAFCVCPFSMREVVSFAGSLVESARRSPLFEMRHNLLFGCFSCGNYETRLVARTSMSDSRNNDRFVWCSDRPMLMNVKGGGSPRNHSGNKDDDLNGLNGVDADASCDPSRVSMEDTRARLFWQNASQFKFAYSPFGNGSVEYYSLLFLFWYFILFFL
jgi:hypothetical protein